MQREQQHWRKWSSSIGALPSAERVAGANRFPSDSSRASACELAATTSFVCKSETCVADSPPSAHAADSAQAAAAARSTPEAPQGGNAATRQRGGCENVDRHWVGVAAAVAAAGRLF